jgi:hypothetical protein
MSAAWSSQLTSIVPCMPGWKVHTWLTLPAFEAVNLKVLASLS